mmetsp:Transcript_27899/g.53090  ORF Transcript_27899/g.53090 Transcript_27899/m.53090 type:complete len:215 (+) Transcript_27899:508-1152(+)
MSALVVLLTVAALGTPPRRRNMEWLQTFSHCKGRSPPRLLWPGPDAYSPPASTPIWLPWQQRRPGSELADIQPRSRRCHARARFCRTVEPLPRAVPLRAHPPHPLHPLWMNWERGLNDGLVPIQKALRPRPQTRPPPRALHASSPSESTRRCARVAWRCRSCPPPCLPSPPASAPWRTPAWRAATQTPSPAAGTCECVEAQSARACPGILEPRC